MAKLVYKMIGGGRGPLFIKAAEKNAVVAAAAAAASVAVAPPSLQTLINKRCVRIIQ